MFSNKQTAETKWRKWYAHLTQCSIDAPWMRQWRSIFTVSDWGSVMWSCQVTGDRNGLQWGSRFTTTGVPIALDPGAPAQASRGPQSHIKKRYFFNKKGFIFSNISPNLHIVIANQVWPGGSPTVHSRTPKGLQGFTQLRSKNEISLTELQVCIQEDVAQMLWLGFPWKAFISVEIT